MIIIDTSSKANKVTDHRAPAGCQPDCVVYHRTCEEKDGLNASLVDFFIEFKTDHDYDPFAHRGDTLLCDTKNGSETCGQITSYATLLLGTQYCTHIFCILVIKDYARLIRWDCAGAIVTEPIYYDDEPHLLTSSFVSPPQSEGNTKTQCWDVKSNDKSV